MSIWVRSPQKMRHQSQSDLIMKHLASAVHNTIANYQLTSKSKLFHRLKPKHEKRIVDDLVKNDKAKQLLELIHKRDYYNKKIYELLNTAAEELDPKLIVDETDAEEYLKKIFMQLPEKVQQVESLIKKHTEFQVGAKERYEIIQKKHLADSPKYKGLSKFASMNANSQLKKMQALNSEMRALTSEVSSRQKVLAKESEAMLRILEVPFFTLESELADLERKKVFVLGVLSRLIGKRV